MAVKDRRWRSHSPPSPAHHSCNSRLMTMEVVIVR
jgi:hypothetical protein